MLEQQEQAMVASTWWIEWARATASDVVTTVVEGEKVEVFARKCYRMYFQKKMDKEMYFQCCCLVWMVQWMDRGASAGELWEATLRAVEAATGDDSCMSAWILPKLSVDNDFLNPLLATTTTEEDSEEHYLHLLMQFWKRFYQACDESHHSARPTKRQRTHYHYSYAYSSGSSSFATNALDDLMKGSYKLAAIILWSNVHLAYGVDSWQELHDLVYGLPQIFKTLTADDIQAALAVVGMQYLIQGRNIAGLSPWMLIDRYLTRAG